MNDKELLTIKEFAEAAGVTQQAVYQRLNKSLKDFVVVVEGKKRLQKAALAAFQRPQEETQVEQDSIKVEQEFIKALQATVSMLENQLKVLENQLEAKDQQIAELNERLKEAMEISKAHVVLSVADRQQLPPTQEEITEASPETKPDLWARFKGWFK